MLAKDSRWTRCPALGKRGKWEDVLGGSISHSARLPSIIALAIPIKVLRSIDITMHPDLALYQKIIVLGDMVASRGICHVTTHPNSRFHPFPSSISCEVKHLVSTAVPIAARDHVVRDHC